MLDGKKHIAEKAVYSALELAAKKLKSEEPLEVFEKAFRNIQPNFEVKSRRVGGANYQIPFRSRATANSTMPSCGWCNQLVRGPVCRITSAWLRK